MKGYLIKRILALLPVMIVVATVVFTIIHLTPGNPAEVILGEEAEAEDIKALEIEMGLDKPIPVQLSKWFFNMLKGDLGNSLYYDKPVSKIIIDHTLPTLQLTLFAFCINLILGITIGVIAAAFHNSIIDNILMFFASIGISLPVSWIGLVLMLLFSIKYQIFPVAGYMSFAQDPIRSFIYLMLPALTLGAGASARLARMTRANMLEVLKSDYIKTARAKGVSETIVLFGHAFKNAFVPTLTVLGLSLANMMGGAVVTEQIYGIPGIGRLLIFSVFNRDYPLVQGIVLYIALIYVVINLVIDILYSIIDPRISYS